LQIAEIDLSVNQSCDVFFSFLLLHLFPCHSFSRRRTSPVQRPATVAQALRRLLRSDIALRLGHEFIADEELPHGGAAEEGRVEVDVEVRGFDFFGRASQWGLVEAHACGA
jgi:hypothetical protein